MFEDQKVCCHIMNTLGNFLDELDWD